MYPALFGLRDGRPIYLFSLISFTEPNPPGGCGQAKESCGDEIVIIHTFIISRFKNLVR